MIPEQARNEIIQKRAAGQTWTSLVKYLKDKYGIEVHRTTVQRWHDREICSEILDGDEFTDEDILLRDKKVETLKGEVKLWKRLYEKSIKESVKKDIIVDSIHSLTPAFRAVPIPTPKLGTSRRAKQIVVAPLSDTHVGDNVKGEQL